MKSTLPIFIFLLLCSFKVFSLTVSFSPSTLLCGNTSVTATFNCNFNGTVLLSSNGGGLVTFSTTLPTVTNGVSNFTISVSPGAPDPITITALVISSDMSCAVFNDTASDNITNDCVLPANNDCSGATSLSVTIGSTCTLQSFNTQNATGSTAPSCAISGYNDLWYSFVAVNPIMTASLGTLPGTVGYLALYAGSCTGTESNCRIVFPNTSQSLTGLSVGTTYYLQLRYLPSFSGNQQICMRSDVSLALDSDLEYFNVQLENQTVSLRWKAYSEIDFKSICLEKTTQSLGDFAEIARFSHGNTEDVYIYSDDLSFSEANKTIYYRLKLEKINGTYSYSEIKKVFFSYDKIKINVFPNPTNEILYINLDSSEDISSDLNYTIYDALGNVIITYKGSDLLTSFNSSSLSKGIYYVHLSINDKIIIKQFEKL